MSVDLTTAIAVPFSFLEDPSYDLRVSFASGASPADATIANGTYRIHLAPTSGSVVDLLRLLETNINTELASIGRAETVSVTMTARGRVTLAISAGTCTWAFSSSLAALLGFTATSYSAVASITSTHVPRHFYVLVGGDTQGAQEATELAAQTTTAGAVVGIQSGVKRWTETISLTFIPKNPTLAAAADEPADWSAWEPTPGGGTTYPWTLAELRRTALAQQVAITQRWGYVRTSTSEPYELGYIDPESLRAPLAPQQFPGLEVWRTWELSVVYPCDGTNTWLRATATRA